MHEGQGEYTGDEESTGESTRVREVNEGHGSQRESWECITVEHI